MVPSSGLTRAAARPARALNSEGQPLAHAFEQGALVDELKVFVGEIEAGFDVGKQVEQVVAQGFQGPADAAGELSEGLLEFIAAAGLDDGEDGFGASEVEFSGEEGAQGELAGLGRARTGFEEFGDQQVNKGRGGDGVHFDEVLAGVGSRLRPDEERSGK